MDCAKLTIAAGKLDLSLREAKCPEVEMNSVFVFGIFQAEKRAKEFLNDKVIFSEERK